MKYIIDIPDDTQKIIGFRQDYSLIYVDMTPYTEPDRNAIEDEVWEFVCKFVWAIDDKKILGTDILHAVRDMSYQEAKAKYAAWKKQKDEIHVGDELKDDENIRAVVLDILDADYESYEVITENGIVDVWQKGIVVKTGRHFGEIEELLKKMRDES